MPIEKVEPGRSSARGTIAPSTLRRRTPTGAISQPPPGRETISACRASTPAKGSAMSFCWRFEPRRSA
ncbi:MAG TPA: hypothetical protein PLB01_19780 [Thermoanaerobaculia bacterium]|nr:hypothetical protein [Thermoanaerobaculia bacterium]